MNPTAVITAEKAEEFLKLTRKDITMSYLRDLFAVRMGETRPKYNTYDEITIPVGKFENKEPIKTTLGRYIVNLMIIPQKYFKKYGFVNETLTKKSLKKVESRLGDMLLNDEIECQDFITYLDNGEWLGMGTDYFTTPSYDYSINKSIPEVIKRRDELFEKYKKEISAHDPNIANKIESELIPLASDILKKEKQPAMDFYDSGVFAFGNAYKKTSIMGGATLEPYTNKINILRSNYIDGIEKNEFDKFTHFSLTGGYSRGVATQSGGYKRKKIDGAQTTVLLDEKDSDCGTKETLNIVIKEEVSKLFLHRYIVDTNGSLTLLTDENLKNYIGKEVRLRSPLYCKSDKICNKCAGELFYKMGIKNAGLLTNSMARSVC